MKSMRLLLTLISLVAMLGCLTGCGLDIVDFPTNIFPSIHYGLYASIGQGTATVQMYQGWYQGQVVWYIARDTNLIRPIQQSRVETDILDTLCTCPKITSVAPYPIPKLTSALEGGAPLVYFVTNYQQGPIFTTVPGNPDYSGLWRVVYITWRPGAVRRAICSASELPSGAEATFDLTNIVVDDPIMAVGRLGGPWNPAPAGTYRIPQALGYDVYAKTIDLPTWATFARDPVKRTILQTEVLVTDVSDPVLAELLRANYAPGLLAVPASDTQRLWVFDWTQDPAPPPGQLPVMEHVIRNVNGLNVEREYSPVMQLNLLRRVGIPPKVFNNPELIENCLPPNGSALEVVNADHRLNVLLLDYHKWNNGPVYTFRFNHEVLEWLRQFYN